MKKLISVLVVLAMLLAVLPVAVLAADNYYVAGESALCGSDWNASDANNLMTLDGSVYVKVYTAVPAGNYNFKITDGTWTNSWGDNGQNYGFANNIQADVTITFDPSTKAITVTGAGVGAVIFEADSITAVGAGAGGFLNNANWNPADASNHMTNNNGVWTITYTGVAAGSYEFKFAANDAWSDSWGTGAAVNSGEWYDAYYNGNNSTVTVAEDDSTVTLTLDLSAFDFGTKSGAQMKVDVATSASTPATYELVNGVTQNISIPVGGSVNVVVDATASDMILNVNGNRMCYDWNVQAGMFPTGPNNGGFAEIQLPAGTVYTLPITNTSEDTVQVVDVTASAPKFGTWDNPAQLVMGENVADASAMGYYYTWTATEDGELTIAIDTLQSTDWTFVCNVFGASFIYGDMHYSDDATTTSFETVSVSAGDEVEIMVGTASYGEATVVLNASFEAGSQGGDDGDGDGGESGGDVGGTLIDNGSVDLTSGANEQSHTVEWTAPANGIVYIAMSSESNPGWAFVMHNPDGSSSLQNTGNTDQVYEYPVVEGETYIFEFWAYSIADWGMADGTVVYEISFEASSGDQGGSKEEYIVSDVILTLGDNTLTLDANAITTIYEFVPEQNGTYKFTANDSSALVGYWGAGSFFVSDYTENKTNVLEYTVPSVGPSIMVGISGVENVTLNIDRVGDYVPEEQPDWEEYENKAELDYFYLDELLGEDDDLYQVDVTDDIPEDAVLGEDGYYHLNTAEGPILVIDLSEYLSPAAGNGSIAYVEYGPDGKPVVMIDYTNAVMEYDRYDDDGFYPLTADLIEILKNYGTNQGWYVNDGTGFYLFDEGVVVDPDTAWLTHCYYIGNEDTVIPELPEKPDETPDDETPDDETPDDETPDDETPDVVLGDYYVAGVAGLCGSEWDPADSANQMIDAGNGIYTITYTDVAPGEYEFKITKGSWAENWGIGGADGENVKFTVDATADVTITFNAETYEITVTVGTEEIPVTTDVDMTGIIVLMVLASFGVAVVYGKKKFF